MFRCSAPYVVHEARGRGEVSAAAFQIQERTRCVTPGVFLAAHDWNFSLPERALSTPSPQTSGLPRRVYTYIGLKIEVCVHVEIAKVCIHVPAPKSAGCVKEQFAKVCNYTRTRA